MIKEITRSMLGRSYKLGGNGKRIGEPFDCFGMMVEYFKLRYNHNLLSSDSAFSSQFNDYTELYLEKPNYAFVSFDLFLDENLNKSNKDCLLSGDLLLSTIDGKQAFGIYFGSQKMMITSDKTGCIMISTIYYKLKEAYRWAQPHHS